MDTGISESEVFWICASLDAKVTERRDRTLTTRNSPTVFLDATDRRILIENWIDSPATVVATGRGPLMFDRNMLASPTDGHLLRAIKRLDPWSISTRDQRDEDSLIMKLTLLYDERYPSSIQ